MYIRLYAAGCVGKLVPVTMPPLSPASEKTREQTLLIRTEIRRTYFERSRMYFRVHIMPFFISLKQHVAHGSHRGADEKIFSKFHLCANMQVISAVRK